ncbi:RNA polymerase II subunit A C-terminal domain phosphatase isoform X2 [Panulirus ornatus]
MMGNICCDCGVLLEEKDIPKTEAVSMLHAVPDLKIARNEAQKLGKEDIDNLLKQRKLVLLVDLDQTLIHTTNDNIPPDLKDVYHFQISHGGPWYHARLRPHTKEFLEKISMYYELHISTFGVREYAHHIAHFLDPDRMLFGQRILSRNECLDVMSKKANLDSLFPCGDNLVCIIDDRTDVWNYSPNVVQVLPYHFFRHTGDINAPQGLQKKENDDREGIDFKDIKKENIKTIGFRPGDTTVAEKDEDDDDDEDKKNYSSDSDSDKDSKEVNPETKSGSDLDSCKNSNNSDVGCDVKENRKDEKVNTYEMYSVQCPDHKENEKKYESTQSPDSVAKDGLTNDGVIENVQNANKKSDQCNMNKKNENASIEEIQMKDVDEIVNSKRTDNEAVNIRESNRRKDEEMECNNQPSDKTIAQSKTGGEGQVFDVVDSDDYLLYLEDILKQIHKRFFVEYDASQQQVMKTLPDLKTIVPAVRKKVFNGVNIVFSGVVPQQMKLRDSKAYHIATSLGSSVSERLVLRAKGDTENVEKKNMYTTHMVAANLHTEKVNIARKHKYIKIVTPNWLWKCAERWEHVEERLFPLNKETEKEIQRLPPHHCFSPDPSLLSYDSDAEQTDPGPSRRTRTQSGQLLEDVNPLMFFSPDEKNNMTDEVEKILSDDDDDESDQEDAEVSSSDSNSNENDYDEDEDEGPRRKKFKGIEDQDSSTNDRWIKRLEEGEEMENDDELPSVIFRQGGGLPSDDSDDGESDDEGDLSRMGADLESLLS